jgi:glutamate carboxypeptidase
LYYLLLQYFFTTVNKNHTMIEEKIMDFSQLKALVEINSWTKNKEGVDRNGELFRGWMEEMGFVMDRYSREDIGDHLHFRSAHQEGLPRLLLLGHLDTVFPQGSFEGFREDSEWVYGAGVCDMKGGNFVALESLRAIYRRFGSITNIDFLLVSDEETGSDDSKGLSTELASLYDYCLVFEAAGVHEEVVIGRKGVGTFFIEIEGKASHAGNHYSKGCDANLELSHKLQALVALTNLDRGTTVNVGKISGGIGANTISPHASLTFELRYTNTQERDRVLQAIEQIVATAYVEGTKTTLSGGIQRDVMEPSVGQEEFIDQINQCIGRRLLVEQRGGVSDANIVSCAGVVTLDGFGPYGDGDHTVDERASKASFISRIEIVTKILEAFMQGEMGTK